MSQELTAAQCDQSMARRVDWERRDGGRTAGLTQCHGHGKELGLILKVIKVERYWLKRKGLSVVNSSS